MSSAILQIQTKEEYQQIIENQKKVNEIIADYLQKTKHNKKV